MNWSGIFIADDRPRPLWRFFLSVVLLFTGLVLTREMWGAVCVMGRIHPSEWAAAFLPVSELTIAASVLTARVGEPIWLTGGPYGPEGSLPARGAILVATVYLSYTKSIYTSEEMRALVFAPVKSKRPDPPIMIFSAPPGEEAKRD